MSGAALSDGDLAFLERARRAHLATASPAAEPHVVPVCFAVLDRHTLGFAVDDKPKPAGRVLKRLRNLAATGRFAIVVDRWEEDWRRLGYLLLSGSGRVCANEGRRRDAITALRARYPQYVEMGLDAGRHAVIELTVERVHRWGDLG